MGYFLLYQALPLAAAWGLFLFLDRFETCRRHAVPALFLAGALLQLAFWWGSTPSLENPDSLGFHRLSRGLEHDLRSLLYRPRLYPWFLSLFPSLEAATLAQCLLKLATAFLVHGLLVRLGAGFAARALGVALCLGNSMWLQEPLQILDTTLFTFLFTAFLRAAAEVSARFSAGRWLALGACAGLAALCRQVADAALLAVYLLLLAPLLFGPARPPRFVLLAGGAALAAALASSGAVANAAEHGVFRRSVALGVNVYTHRSYHELHDSAAAEWDFVLSRLPDARAAAGTWDPHWRAEVAWPANALPHRLERALGTATRAEILAADRALSGRYWDWVRREPARFAASAWNEAVRLLWKSEEYYPSSVAGRWLSPPATVTRVERGLIHQPPALLLLLAVAGAFPRNRRARLLAAAGVCAYLVPIPLLQIGFTRYALPALPVLFALAALGLEAAWSAGSRAARAAFSSARLP